MNRHLRVLTARVIISVWSAGAGRIDPLFQPNELARTGGAEVAFEPVSRTAWQFGDEQHQASSGAE
jgi:hypothetical protein